MEKIRRGSSRKETETTHKIPAFRSIPAEIPIKSADFPVSENREYSDSRR
jgi:hypothetical protein